LHAQTDGPRKRDAERLLAWFETVTGLKAQMWGPSMIGFGRYRYTYDSGRTGEAMMTGFSPRPRETVIYIVTGFDTAAMRARLEQLGPHKIGKACLYLKRHSELDMDVLAQMVSESIGILRDRYPTEDA
jgi:hypothetical protein